MSKYDVAAYIWPSYHHEPRLAHIWTEGDGEWSTVRGHAPRFPGHDMPKWPLLGHQDEADPAVAAQHVQLALDHGINVFIMDWYWYDDAPCFERQLDEGLMPACEGTDMRFCLMWANHDATTAWNPRAEHKEFMFSAGCDRPMFERIWSRNIAKYFTHPNYYRIDGKPVLSIFLVPRLIADLGGIEAMTDAFAWLQDEARRQGLPGVHLQAIHWQKVPHEVVEIAPETAELDMYEIVRACNYDSCTNYQMVQCAGGEGDYVQWAAEAMGWWERNHDELGAYFPHVSIGWDNTHRFPTQQVAVTGRTPWAFEACLHKAKAYLDARPDQHRFVTINSWNEWTEDSYLLPDLRWGYAYLEAVKRVFGS